MHRRSLHELTRAGWVHPKLPDREGAEAAAKSTEGGVTGLVGRGPELGALRAAVDAALAGTVQVALITGEPGIGKTRLAEAFAEVAAGKGVEVLWSVCGGRTAPAFWPWSQALRVHVDNVGSARLAAELGDGAAELATILPELRQRLPALPEPRPAEGAAARYRTFAAVTRFLMAAGCQPAGGRGAR